MKRFLMISLVAVGLVILTAGFTTPIFAHDTGGGKATSSNGETWEEMHQACENGDYEAMTQWHAQYHDEEGSMNKGMMRGGMMGSGMMGSGMMGSGMMGSGMMGSGMMGGMH